MSNYMRVVTLLGGIAAVLVGCALWRSFVAFRRRFVPVLLYHALTDDPRQRDEMTVHVAAFRRQMRWLAGRGYRITHCSALGSMPDRRRGKTAVVTFDDGFSSVYRWAAPVLRETSARATVFLSTDFVERGTPFPWPYAVGDPPLSWDQVRELQSIGVTFGSHGCSHTKFTELDTGQLSRELRESRRAIKRECGEDTTLLAYPFGEADGQVRRVAAVEGYTKGYVVFAQPDVADEFMVARILIRNQTSMLGFRLRVTGIHPYLKSRRWFTPLRRLLVKRRWAYF